MGATAPWQVAASLPTIITRREGKSIAKRKTTTSSEVKSRWNRKTYRSFQANLRREEDADLIAWVDANRDRYGPTDIFRAGVETLKSEGLK